MSIPILAPNITWFAPNNTSITRAIITEIEFVDTYVLTGSEIDSWDASEAKDNSVMAYVTGTKLTIAGNGSGKIFANPDSRQIFYASGGTENRFGALTTITNAQLLDTSNVTAMSAMFAYCRALVSLDVSSWDTSACTEMSYMFYFCTALTSLDLSKWDVSNVTRMHGMFQGSSGYDSLMNLTELNVSGWDTSSCTNMHSMFSGCHKLKTIAVDTWVSTSACTDMGWMFWGCRGLTTLDISKWDTSNVESFHHFACHTGLNKIIGIEDINLTSCKTIRCMLDDCPLSGILDVSKWNTSNVEDFSAAFAQMWVLKGFKGLKNLDTSNGKAFHRMFDRLDCVTELDLSGFDTRNATITYDDPYSTSTGTGMNKFFDRLPMLKSIKLGENFSFDGSGDCTGSNQAVLVTPTTDSIPETRGVWYNTATLQSYKASEIPNRTAGEYSCVPVDVLIKNTTVMDFVEATKKVSGSTDKMTPSTAASALTYAIENNDLYASGYEDGKQAEYDAFWDNYQQKGKKIMANYLFYTDRWNDTNYNPKYDIVCSSCISLFYGSKVSDTKVAVDCRGIQAHTTFAYCVSLHTIRKFIVDESTTYERTFVSCSALRNLVIEGVIGNTVSLSDSPLSKASIKSVINALSNTATGQTITFKKTAVNNTFTTDEWNALVATKPNWTITLV